MTVIDINKIGRLRPWEYPDYTKKLANTPEKASQFATDLHAYVKKEFGQKPTTEEVEDVLHIAMDALEILKKRVIVLREVKDDSVSWLVFLGALDGKCLAELMAIASAHDGDDDE